MNQFDLTPLHWSSAIERKIRAWANRKAFGVAWHYNHPMLNVCYCDDGTSKQKEKATKTLCTIIRREKMFAVAQTKN